MKKNPFEEVEVKTSTTKEKIEIELHVMFAEPFDNRKTNEYLEKIYYLQSIRPWGRRGYPRILKYLETQQKKPLNT